MCYHIEVPALHDNLSVPLQAQHQIRVMLLWWVSRGAPAHLPLMHYPLTPEREALTKAHPTVRPEVSTPVMLWETILNRGKNIPQTVWREV